MASLRFGMRYSGHEWFPCRYAWLPKAYRELREHPKGLADEERAVERLGIGKNMVRSLKFWATAMDVIVPTDDGGHAITPFGEAIFRDGGFDPFLEDVRTLWLLHWHLASADDPLFAWDFLLNHWQRPEIIRSIVLPEFIREANSGSRTYSEVTLRQHLEVFLQVYIPVSETRAGAGEDYLDSPLVELELIETVGERMVGRRREPVYAFRREAKPEITPALFTYCLADYWRMHRPAERTLTFREVASAPSSPGQLLKLPEADLRARLETIGEDSSGIFAYQESVALAQVTRSESTDVTASALFDTLLHQVYEPVVV